MKRTLRKKLCAAVFLCAFACGISAAPVLAITVSGVVMTIDRSGGDEPVPDATVTLFDKQGQPIDQKVSGADGSFSFTVAGDELPDVYFLTTKDTYVNTYSQSYHFVVDENELELPILPLEETQAVIDSVADTDHRVDESKGIIAGVVEIKDDDDLTGLAGVSVKATDGFDNQIACDTLYLNADQDWDPTLNKTSTTGVFALYNIPDVPRMVVVALEGADPKYFFVRTGGKVFAYNASPESITVAFVIGWDPGSGEDTPIDDGGGGGGCFVSGISP